MYTHAHTHTHTHTHTNSGVGGHCKYRHVYVEILLCTDNCIHVCPLSLPPSLQHDFVNRAALCADLMLPLIIVMGAPPPKPKTPVNDDDTEEESEEREPSDPGVRVGVAYCEGQCLNYFNRCTYTNQGAACIHTHVLFRSHDPHLVI